MFYNPYQPYPANFQNTQNYQMNPVMLPQEQVTQVEGRAEAEKIQLGPNSSRLVMDKTAPLIWLCVSDGVGQVTATPYDIHEHVDTPPVDMGGIEQRLAAVEAYIAKQMEVQTNAEPDAPAPATEPAGVTYTAKRGYAQNSK